MECGGKIRKARMRALLSQDELAEKIGIHITGVSAYERGVRVPKLNAIVTYAKAIGCSPMDLLPDSFLEACKEFEKEKENC